MIWSSTSSSNNVQASLTLFIEMTLAQLGINYNTFARLEFSLYLLL